MSSFPLRSGRSIHGLTLLAALSMGFGGLALSGTDVRAQATEQNLAPVIRGESRSALTFNELVDMGEDPTPFGVTLRRLVIVDERLNGRDIKPRGTVAGVVTTQAAALVQTEEFTNILSQFVEQPLSFKLISEIQAAVTQYYRDKGRPLVSVTVPPQEISDGGLQINVISFVLDETSVTGNKQVSDAFLLNQIRQKPGEDIDAAQLTEDINWLNLNPYRRIQGVFEPGDVYGTTDIVLEVEEQRPWSAYLGMSNTGIEPTGKTRLFAGFNTAQLPLPDHQLAYQFTVAPDSLARGDVLNGTEGKGYVSHAVTYFAPFTFGNGTRSTLTLQAYHVGNYGEPDAFSATETTENAFSAELAFPLSVRSGKLAFSPEVYTKFEHKQKQEDQFFGGFAVSAEKTRINQISLGIRANNFGTLFGLKTNGSVDAFAVAGNNRVSGEDDGSHSYAGLEMQQEFLLENDMTLAFKVSGQWSGAELPAPEQFGLGGAGTVRGYQTNELSSHQGIAASAEVRGKKMTLDSGGLAIGMVPFGFFDVGRAEKTTRNPAVTISSVGVGAKMDFGKRVSGVFEVALPLRDSLVTLEGETTAHFNLVSRF